MTNLASDLPADVVERIESRMRPGAMLASGFLAPGESLLEVVRRDTEALRAIAVDPGSIADGLESILVAAHDRVAKIDRGDVRPEAKRPMDYPAGPSVLVENRYRVYGFGGNMRGLWPCPFESPSNGRCAGYEKSLEFRNQSFTIRNQVRQFGLAFSVLLIHLIREHHFFEGDVEHRVDPVLAARVLDLYDEPAAKETL